jgi:pilus assembly protein CpaC
VIHQRFRSSLIGLTMTAAAVVGSAAASYAESANVLSVASGSSIVLHTEGLTRVAVGDGRIAGVVPIGTSQLVINGKSPGHTTVLVWAGGRRLVYDVAVTEQNVDTIAKMLRSAINEPNVQVIGFGKSVVVKGTVNDAAHFQEISDVIGRFDKIATAENYKIVNAVTVLHPLGQVQALLANIPGAADVRVDPDGKGNVIVSGRVHERFDAERILELARGLAGAYLSADGKVLDRLTVETASQVDVKVYILEIDRVGLKDLGLNLQGGTPDPGDPFNPYKETIGPPAFQLIEKASLGPPFNISSFVRTTSIAPIINLVVQSGHAKVLSSPNLTTVPGKEATFLVGGEVPYVVSNGNVGTTVVFKEYGVRLNMTPILLGNGQVETKITPEISALDFADGISYNGFVVPSLKTSRISTDVITKAGESIIMGGLLARIEERNYNKIPLLGDLPILGQLFRSVRYKTGETDVVFVMTPEVIVR